MENLQHFFLSLNGFWGYGFLFLASVGENLFPPMPGDTFVVLGAFLVGRGQLAWWPAYLATTAGSISGFMILFTLGRRWGRNLVNWRGGRVFSPAHLAKAEVWFGRWGYGLIAVNRFLSGFRAVVSLAAGMARMHPAKVFALALLSCLLWNAALMALGLWVGENWQAVLQEYQKIAAAAVLVAVVLLWFHQRRKKRNILQS